MKEYSISIDLMGGDQGPLISVPAVKQALSYISSTNFNLYGDERIVLDLLKTHKIFNNSRVNFYHCEGVITNEDNVLHVLRKGKNSSLWKAIESVAKNDSNGVVTSGSTAALVSISNYLLGNISNVHRSALVQILPTLNKKGTVFLDLGANMQTDARMLLQYAIMGRILSNKILGIENPRISLLNVGVEESKGTKLVQEASSLITSDKSNNFVGYVEGNDIFGNKTDVIVTDGFTGNITLKTAEGLYNMMQNKISDGSKSSVLLSLIKYFYKRKIGFMQPDKFNGACLIGTKGVVVKSHGGANKQAFVAAIKQAKEQIEVDLPKLISDGI